MRIPLPIDIFSKKRLLFNTTIYIAYTSIFVASFLAATVAVNGTDAFQGYTPLLFLGVFLPVAVIKFFIFNFFNFKRFALYSSEFYDISKTAVLVMASVILFSVLRHFAIAFSGVPVSFFVIDALVSFCAIIVFNASFRFLYGKRSAIVQRFFTTPGEGGPSKRYLIVGAGVTGQSLHRTLRQHSRQYDIAGFLDDAPELIGKQIQGVRIHGPIRDAAGIAAKLGANHLIIAMPSAPARRVREILNSVRDTKITVSTVPSFVEIIDGKVKIDSIREIRIDDLLKRERVEIDVALLSEKITGSRVLVTGAAGSIGSELCRQIIRFDPAALIVLDQAETPLFYLERTLGTQSLGTAVVPVIADITNRRRLVSVFQEHRPQMVFHAAAYKHVPMMEENFKEAILNNVLGTKNVADLANLFSTDLFVMISTDKAVNPTSVMGLTKRIAEIYIQSMNQISATKFMTVRFGNVLDSGGNVVQVFKQQIETGGPLTVTHPGMTRYFMLTSEAVQLVLQAGLSGNGGEIFLLDMGEPMKVLDLAEIMIKIAGYEAGKDIDIVYTGLRPGEKLFEELRCDGEDFLATPHPKIFVWKSRPFDWEAVSRDIAGIIETVYTRSRDEIIEEIMRALVPEYDNGIVTETEDRALVANSY